MIWILLGAIISCFNFNLTIGLRTVGVLPDTIGYILLIIGMLLMEKQTYYLYEFFQKSKRLAALLAVMSGVEYLCNLMGWKMSTGGVQVAVLWGTVQLFLIFSCWQGFIYGMAEIQKREDTDLRAGALLKAMSVMILVRALEVVMFTFNNLFVPIVIVCMIAVLVVTLSFVIQIFYTKRRYDLFCREQREKQG